MRFIFGLVATFILGPFILPTLLTTINYPFTRDEFDISNYPVVIPPTNSYIEFELTPHKTIVFNNGTETFSKIFIKRETSYDLAIYKHPRGIMIKISNESTWDSAINCFYSYPTPNPNQK